MSAQATCSFPLVDEWKDLADKNILLGYIDSVISGFAQIAFSDNPFTGILLIIGIFLGSWVQAVSAIWATCIATLMAYLIGAPKPSIRLGVYSMNAALAGLAMPVFVYSNNLVLPGILIYSTLAAVFCVILTAAFTSVLSKWDIPILAFPYSFTLLIIVPASFFLPGINPNPSVMPYLVDSGGLASFSWQLNHVVTSILNGFAQIMWQKNIISGIIYIVALLLSSRVDVFTAIISTIASTLTAISLGLPSDAIMIGIYGYNAILIGQATFGRTFRMSVGSFVLYIVLSSLSVIIAGGLAVIFAPLSIPLAAFPYVIIMTLIILGRDAYARLSPISYLRWGVPETIERELRDEERNIL